MGVNNQTDARQSCKAPVVQFPSFPRQYPEGKEITHEDFTPALFETVGKKRNKVQWISTYDGLKREIRAPVPPFHNVPVKLETENHAIIVVEQIEWLYQNGNSKANLKKAK